MNDMSHAIIPKSDQINADDLISGPINITIESVEIKGGQEQPVSIFFAGSEKAFRPCKSMSRVLVAAWGPDANRYVGRSLTLYRDPTVKWGGMDVGGIRISHMTDIDNPMTMALTATKGSRKPFTVKPLQAPAATTDKVADGVRTLIARIGSVDPKNLAALMTDPVVVKQRAYIAEKRPELAAKVDQAIAAKTPDDDPFADRPSSTETLAPENTAEPAGDLSTDAEQDEAASNSFDVDAEKDITDHIGNKVRIADVNALINSRIGELDEEAADRVRHVAMLRIAAILKLEARK